MIICETRMAGALQARKVGVDQIVFSRTFDAQIDTVFAALTAPRHLLRWLYSGRDVLVECEDDMRPGGQTVFFWETGPERIVTSLTFFWIEIEPPVRLVNRQMFSDWPAGRVHAVTTLAPRGRRTLYTAVMTHTDGDIRDAVFSTPLVEQLEEGFARLDGLLSDGLEET